MRRSDRFLFVLGIAAGLVFDAAARAQGAAAGRELPAWTRGATCYEIFVRSFWDSDGDGIGDLNGVTAKLDYLNDGDSTTTTDLGVRCLWLMPINPSPSYHGYDVTDYYHIERDYGTEADFERLIAEAHRRGIRVVIDMVLNHTSSEHPFFQSAALYQDASPYRDWYLWLPGDPGIRNEWGGSNWHKSPFHDEWYYGFFYGGMPDLDLRNPQVIAETERIARFWLLSMNVDGFRLDAVRHLVENDSGRLTTNQPGTHDFLRGYAAFLHRIKPDAYTIGEVNDSNAVLQTYHPDQLDSYFAFEVAERIIDRVRRGSAGGLLDPILELQRTVPGQRWSPFLRNHDQNRTMTDLGGDMAKARVAATLLFAMPGMPFVYYGEEIGMTGAKPDPRIRTPMQWSAGPGAGFTSGVPWEPLQPDSMTANVGAMEGDSSSLLALYRRLIHARSENPALATGELVPLSTSNDAVTAFVRREGGRVVLCVANLGDTPVSSVRLTSDAAGIGLAPGRYRLRDVLGGGAGAGSLSVERGGRITGAAPWRSIPGKAAWLLEVARVEGVR